MAFGNTQPVRPNKVPERMPMMIGLVSTAYSVLARPRGEKLPCRAHSTETVSKVQRINELKTSTSATDGSAATPSASLASGKPSMRLLENTPPSANTDCDTPSSAKTFHAIRRPMPKTIRQPPKNAISRRASTGGRLEKSLNSRNKVAGSATEKTKRVRLSETTTGHFVSRIRA